MLNQYSKAIVALLMAIVQILNIAIGLPLLDEAQVTSAVAILTALLVYVVPNKGGSNGQS